MDQNQFSRQLIVLRAIINGYTGHARLLNCATGQELELRVQAPAGMRALYAVVVEHCETGYRGCPLGALTVDERGQATGTFSLAAAGITPEILAIVEQTDDSCLLAMSGFLSGARNVNWAGVRSAACEAVATNACSDCVPGIQPRDVDSPTATELPDESDDEASDSVHEDDNGEAEDEQPSEAVESESSESDHADQAGARESEAASAAEAAGIDVNCDWPEEIAALKSLFERECVATPFPGSRYTFIFVPATDEQPAFFVGIWAVNGYPLRVAYAIPGDSPTVQPQGLENFLWRSAADGSGFWTAYIDAQTGEPLTSDY